jgi:SAM-dependent methyltransferase
VNESPEQSLHERIVGLAGLPRGGHGLDLGCGPGPTLAAWSAADPRALLTGLDYSERALERAAGALAGHAGRLDLRRADLSQPLPVPDASVDAVVSFNVLECLAEPEFLLAEAHRVLHPGARAVIGHTDFDALIISGPDRDLDRKIVNAFADLTDGWIGQHADGRVGRKLPGVLAGSALRVESVIVHTDSSTGLTGRAAHRIGNMLDGLGAAIDRGTTCVSAEELAAWHAAIVDADRSGRFFFVETAILVLAVRQ